VNTTPYLHLCWKEYRSIRGFWVCIVALTIFLQVLVIESSTNPRDANGLVFILALAFPALFAVGCAGTAFAAERDEGTYEFLRTVPVRSRQIVISNLTITVLATLVMCVVLLVFALLLTRGSPPQSPMLSDMAGLWLVAALEAIAWGTLFSLMLARPLLAVILAIAAGSTIVNVMAWIAASSPGHMLSLGDYSQVLVGRLLVAAIVFAIDIYLGLNWLHRDTSQQKKSPSLQADHSQSLPESEIETAAIEQLIKKPLRSEMFFRLFWQQWRQSALLMVLMAVLYIPVATFVSLNTTGKELVGAHGYDKRGVMVPMAIFATLMGCFVFRADQERRSFRFFVEHNVPPRYVWLSRQLPWIFAATVSSLVVCCIWLKSESNLGQLWNALQLAMQSEWNQDNLGHLYLPPLPYALSIAAVTFAAGQWISIFVRSGIMSGFFGLLFSGVLCYWVFLMNVMHIPWWWSVASIPLLLLGATWLRAPDWIAENTTWWARLRAGSVVLIPAMALCAAVPIYRVQHIPLVDPGFNPAEYLAGITPQALETAELYRHAANQFELKRSRDDSDKTVADEVPQYDRNLTEFDRAWLGANTRCLKLLLEASQRPTCAMENPGTMTEQKNFNETEQLIPLLITSAREQETEGKLDESLDRYTAALRTISHMSAFRANNGRPWPVWYQQSAAQVLYELPYWAAQPGQTPDRIRTALEMLRTMDGGILHLEDGIKSDYIMQHRAIEGDEEAFDICYGRSQGVFGRILRGKFMPGEHAYNLRMINWLTNQSLKTFEETRSLIDTDGNVVASMPSRVSRYYDPYDVWFAQRRAGQEASWTFTEYEAGRRGTMLQMALEAYRLEHGNLPQSLNDLVGVYFDKLPSDPFSGNDFVYFRDGIPPPPTRLEAKELFENGSTNAWAPAGFGIDAPIVPGKPCVWCTSGQLLTYNWSDQIKAVANRSNMKLEDPVPYYTFANDGYNGPMLPSYTTWGHGFWFPIPAEQKAREK
jgi:hypothetical protein